MILHRVMGGLAAVAGLLLLVTGCSEGAGRLAYTSQTGRPVGTAAQADMLTSGLERGGDGLYHISAAELSDRLKGGANPVLVDVRSREEFSQSHLAGAVNIPLDEIDQRVGELGGTNQPIVVYCNSGVRSAIAGRRLADRGFTSVVVLDGSFRRVDLPKEP